MRRGSVAQKILLNFQDLFNSFFSLWAAADADIKPPPPHTPTPAENPELWKAHSSRPGVGQNMAFRASLTVRNSAFLISAYSVLSTSFSPILLMHEMYFFLTVNLTLTIDLMSCASPCCDLHGGLVVKYHASVDILVVVPWFSGSDTFLLCCGTVLEIPSCWHALVQWRRGLLVAELFFFFFLNTACLNRLVYSLWMCQRTESLRSAECIFPWQWLLSL